MRLVTSDWPTYREQWGINGRVGDLPLAHLRAPSLIGTGTSQRRRLCGNVDWCAHRCKRHTSTALVRTGFVSSLKIEAPHGTSLITINLTSITSGRFRLPDAGSVCRFRTGSRHFPEGGPFIVDGAPFDQAAAHDRQRTHPGKLPICFLFQQARVAVNSPEAARISDCYLTADSLPNEDL